ncbi:hypothetical protein KKA24_02545 [Patescibacteria group bacterium]|nr:hypothetical protein [Patescibacteria group bacterium]
MTGSMPVEAIAKFVIDHQGWKSITIKCVNGVVLNGVEIPALTEKNYSRRKKQGRKKLLQVPLGKYLLLRDGRKKETKWRLKIPNDDTKLPAGKFTVINMS